MSVPADELDMLRTLASAPAGTAQQPPGMIQTDPGNVSNYMQNQQLMQQLGAGSADLEKRAALDKQMMMAKYLGGGPNMPKGQHIPGYMGGVYVAPNALQDTGAAAQYIIGGLAGQKAATEELGMAQREARSRTAIMDMISRNSMQPPMYSPDMSNVQNPLENYNFGPPGGPPRNTNLQPGQAPPRQGTADDFAALQYPGG